MIYVIISIGLVSFVIWVHYTFTTELNLNICAHFIVVVVVIAVLAEIKIFSLIAIDYFSTQCSITCDNRYIEEKNFNKFFYNGTTYILKNSI